MNAQQNDNPLSFQLMFAEQVELDLTTINGQEFSDTAQQPTLPLPIIG